MAFVDLEKRACLEDAMWWVMHKLGIEKWLVHMVQSMYKDIGSRVRVDDGYTEEIGVRVGVPQDTVLSPLLFYPGSSVLAFHVGCSSQMT